VSRLASDLARRLGQLTLAVAVSLSPSTVPEWRLQPTLPPAYVLSVGEPVTPLVRRA